jgi:phospholipase A2
MNFFKSYTIGLRALLLLFVVGFFYQMLGMQHVRHYAKKLFYSPKDFIKSREKVVLENPYAAVQAELRFGNELHPGEREYREKRKPKVMAALEKTLGISLENKHVPTISVICSGGGYRAMLGSIGSWSGLQQIGLLDAITYISTLSGSTWALGFWMSTGMTIAQLKKSISQKIVKDIYKLSKNEAKNIAHMLAVKIAFNQPYTTVDLFGAMIANHLLAGYYGKKCQMVHMSDQVKQISNGDMPFPIYTAVDGRMRAIGKAPWYEFTPFEIGSPDYAAYVPTWAYGRHFSKGKSVDYAPEQSLGFHFGVFGSAFGVHLGLAWERVIKDLTPSVLKTMIEGSLVKSGLEKARVFWAEIPNYMFGAHDYDVTKNKNLKLVDAGIEFNLPYPPVSGERPERMSDIFIFFDFSRTKIPHALKKAESYARRKGLKFPVIDYDGIEKKTISIFKDENDTSVPVVIYMPRISDIQLWESKKLEPHYKKYKSIDGFNFDQCAQNGPCNTINFCYTLHQSRQVMDQMEFNVDVNKQQIIDAIRWVIDKKS